MKFVGNEKAFASVSQLLPTTQSLLLVGPEGVGKRLGAESCAVLVSDIQDIVVHKGPLSIDVTRSTIRSAYMRPFGSRDKTIILECDEFSPESMNAILKLLEEPPPDCHLVLVTSTTLPETVVSRCKSVAFGKMSRSEILEALVLHGMSYTTADRFADAGSVGLALKQYSYEEARLSVQTFLDAVKQQDQELLVRLVQSCGDLEARFLSEALLERIVSGNKNREQLLALHNFLMRSANPKLKMAVVGWTMLKKNVL